MKPPYTIDTNGTVSPVDPPSSPLLGYTLEQLHAFVEGHIEIVRNLHPSYRDCYLIVDEEGALPHRNPVLNLSASVIAGQPIHGKVLVTPKEYVK